ncbi:MAG: response regulator [Rhizobiales bacterium]|nr:response regulator [Hyphomicrobiales bacterium]
MSQASPATDLQPAVLAEPSQAEKALRGLLVASIVLPILIFIGVATIAYFKNFEDARERLLLRLSHAYQHAATVFETFELTARYTGEIFRDESDADIRANEAAFSARLKGVVDLLPQVRDIWIVNADGKPLVAGAIFPIPPGLDVSDRPYFQVHKLGKVAGDFVTPVLDGRVSDIKFFAITRRMTDEQGNFRGVLTVSIAPEYFDVYYANPPVIDAGFTMLIRADGAVLGQAPGTNFDAAKLTRGATFAQAVRRSPDIGVITTDEPDGRAKLVAYRRLPQRAVYVISGINNDAIIATWLKQIGAHLLFGVPATIAMTLLAWVAIRRTRRESLAYAQLRAETQRREATELALRQAQKMEAVGRLTGGIAHDFNNLLTAIIGNIDLSIRRMESGDERVRRYLGSAREGSARAASLVQRLLAFSRQQPLETRTVDLNRVVQNMSELLRRSLGETVVIETVLAGGLWRTAVDPNQIENAILNLAINARDAMGGEGRLTIETANTVLGASFASTQGDAVIPGEYVLLAVTDTGTGMSADVIEKAFEPFFTTKPTGVGTGLGLSMVYGFIRQSGGYVVIDSKVGRGATFNLYLPRATGAERNEDEPAVPVPAPLTPQADGTKILLVEDDPELNRFGTEVLQELGYRVISAPDGPSALKLLARNTDTQLLFTDVVLPNGMNGRELARAAQEQQPGLRVLFTTGYTRDAIVHEGRLDEDVELLTKPFTYDALVAKVKAVLAGRST